MTALKIMIFLWQCGVVDSLTLLQFFINCGSQYSRITLAQAAGDIADIGPGALLAPFQGLGVSYQYIRLAEGMEKRRRVATLASFMAMSSQAMLPDPPTNVAAGYFYWSYENRN